MKLKQFHGLLQGVKDFEKPKQQLEQYITGPHLASQILFTIAESFEDLDEQVVVDLGCGTGMLAIGCALLGCQHVIAIDLDTDALAQAQSNAEEFEDLPIDFVRANVFQLSAEGTRIRADVVVSNPPFGSWQAGADTAFLRAAFRISTGAVYSLHKSSTRAHIEKTALTTLNAQSAEVVAELKYDLPATMKHHKKKSKDIEVDLWRFVVPASDQSE